MAEKEFNVSVSTISGGSVSNILKIKKGRKIDPKYRGRMTASILFSLFAEPFRWWEHLRYDKQINNLQVNEDPVFVLGHWRSGTTFLHNLLCEDPQMAYVTTYQGIFPELLLGSSWLFKTFMTLMMPKKRPSDNVKLNADFPQEEEFALGNMNPYGYYNFWFFPKSTREFYEKYIEFNDVSEDVKKRWKNDYLRLAKKTCINSGNPRFISKNPPHTGRVKMWLDIFPNAKFIHIYRNPITVFISTLKLVESTIPNLKFQNISTQEIEDNILWVYDRMMRSFEEQKKLIPESNLIEIKFEEFEKSPFEQISKIYKMLNISGFEEAKPHFENYIASQKSYKKNKYQMPKSKVDHILKHWQFAMDQWGYDIPENIEIIDNK